MYKAVITILKLSKHPNADRLQIGECFGNRVIVGLDITETTLGLFFESGCQLSKEFCDANDLVSKKDENGNKIGGGLFDDKRFVRAREIRGERSDGFWCPLSCLEKLGVDAKKLKIGDSFDSIDGIPICSKFVLTDNKGNKCATQNEVSNRTKMFPKHFDTKQLWEEVSNSSLNYPISYTVTHKLHGTSGRYGNVKAEKNLSKFQKKWNYYANKFKWLPSFSTHAWKHVLGTRNTVLDEKTVGKESFRFDAVKNITLHKGEIIYFELVGYAGNKPIMAPQSTEPLPNIKKVFGDVMAYSYGCAPGECKLYVYRITQVNEDGNQIDLSWDAVKERCGQLGLNHVPEYAKYRMFAHDKEDLFNTVRMIVDANDLMNGANKSCLDDRHIEEGIVVRVEGYPIKCLKMKSWVFRVLEGHISATVEDREDMS